MASSTQEAGDIEAPDEKTPVEWTHELPASPWVEFKDLPNTPITEHVHELSGQKDMSKQAPHELGSSVRGE